MLYVCESACQGVACSHLSVSRLVIMAQGNSKTILDAFNKLHETDRRTLCEELARTGCEGQRYSTDSLHDVRGPAFLVYYAPAFLQKAGLLDPQGAMRVLAEILRVARTMWPLRASLGGVTVTVRIDALKAETANACQNPPLGQAWVLERVNERSCSVCRAPWPPKSPEVPDDGSDSLVRGILNFGDNRFYDPGVGSCRISTLSSEQGVQMFNAPSANPDDMSESESNEDIVIHPVGVL